MYTFSKAMLVVLDPTNYSSDAMSLVGDRQMTANLLLRRSAEESNHLDNNVMHLQSMIDTLMTQRAQAFKAADILTDIRDKVGREDCPEWNEYMALGASLFEKQNVAAQNEKAPESEVDPKA